jgi:hypothetical protein
VDAGRGGAGAGRSGKMENGAGLPGCRRLWRRMRPGGCGKEGGAGSRRRARGEGGSREAPFFVPGVRGGCGKDPACGAAVACGDGCALGEWRKGEPRGFWDTFAAPMCLFSSTSPHAAQPRGRRASVLPTFPSSCASAPSLPSIPLRPCAAQRSGAARGGVRAFLVGAGRSRGEAVFGLTSGPSRPGQGLFVRHGKPGPTHPPPRHPEQGARGGMIPPGGVWGSAPAGCGTASHRGLGRSPSGVRGGAPATLPTRKGLASQAAG